MEREELKAIVESILLASDQPVSAEDLQKTVMNGTQSSLLREVLEEIKEEYQSRNLQVVQVAEGYQLCTRQEYSDWVRKFLKLDKTTKLSQPSLDTLSIIAYKQPLTRQEVDEIRGVDSSGVMKTLLDKKIIGPAGRKKVPGRPIMYKTTRRFLEYFGLKDLSDLPTLEDLKEELTGEPEESLQGELDFEGEGSGETGKDDNNSVDSLHRSTIEGQMEESAETDSIPDEKESVAPELDDPTESNE